MESYRIVSELTEEQISELTDLYRIEFWSQNRTRQDVAKMLAASDIIIGLVDDCDRLIGFITCNPQCTQSYFYSAWVFITLCQLQKILAQTVQIQK